MNNIEKEIIKLFKTGDFTIVYTDSQDMDIYKGHQEMDEDGTENFTTKPLFRIEDYNSNNGYIPDSIRFLVKALGGKVDSF